jgi:hypothetical protein
VTSLLIPAEFWIAPSLELAFAGLKALLQIVRLSPRRYITAYESELMDSDSEAPGRIPGGPLHMMAVETISPSPQRA